jgi:hypothetical protein
MKYVAKLIDLKGFIKRYPLEAPYHRFVVPYEIARNEFRSVIFVTESIKAGDKVTVVIYRQEDPYAGK